MAMKFKRQLKAEESVNMTPLIDVVFLLLIFFMVSTTFTKESHLEVNLPEADGQPKTEVELKVEVVIDANGAYTVNGKVLLNSQIDTLTRALELVANGDTNVPFVITGDANSSYQSIISVMDTAGKVGFSNISMTTRLPSEPETAP